VSGRLFGVGVGPGDPELVTLKAQRIIATADVVAYPKARRGTGVARRIAGPFLREHQIELPLTYPVTTEQTDDYERLLRAFYDDAAERSPRISTRGATSRCCARATPSSTAPTCTCTNGSRIATPPRSSPA
jgi:precorrin-2 C20-methyltransferase / precorrin-3B C17-methyltransferase